MKTMKKKPDLYFLIPTEIVIEEGKVSFYKILHDGDFSEELLEKYQMDVKDLLEDKLNKLVVENRASALEVDRIKQLIDEVVLISEIMQKNCDPLPPSKKDKNK